MAGRGTAVRKPRPTKADAQASPRDDGVAAPGDKGLAQTRILICDVEPFCAPPHRSIRDLIAQIDRTSEGLALLVDDERRLLATVTDGDIRRAILAGLDIAQPASALVKANVHRVHARPITAPLGHDAVLLLQLMSVNAVHHVPLLDDGGRVRELALLSRLLPADDLPLQAVIMAGGFGTRLRPLTEDTPKPMLPVGDRPLLERTIERLSHAGIRSVNITTHYLAEKIHARIGDGSAYGVRVRYSHEDQPLGTAGALRRFDSEAEEPFLVINGDVMTTVNFRAMLDYHREHGAALTVAVRSFSIKVPYGVVDSDGPHVRAVREKPEVQVFVNAGVYLVEPSACALVPAGRAYDMPDLINDLVAANRTVVSFPVHEYWIDIGQHADYARAQSDVGALGGERDEC